MLEGKNNWKAWLYLAPALALLGLFSFYPIVNSFIIAFVRDETKLAHKAQGLSYFTINNFISVFKNENFGPAIKNTLLIAFISVPCSVILSLIISINNWVYNSYLS